MDVIYASALQNRGMGPFRRLWRAGPPLALVTLAMLAALIWLVPAIYLDPRVVGGALLWIKPTKFALSIAAYSLTLLWMLRYVRGAPRLVRAATWVIAAMFVVEMVLITGQAARERVSHFNVSTLQDAVIFHTMGGAIMLLFVAHMIVAIVLLRQRKTDRTLLAGLRAGLLVAALGMLVGPLMTAPSAEQLELMTQGQNPGRTGGHAVGAPDGGPGLPFTGWSTVAGDLRVAHFVGLHAMQVLPLFALWMRRRRRLVPTTRRRIVRIWSLAYAGLTVLLIIQAYRQQPLIAPDAWTLALLLTLVSAATAATCWNLRGAWRGFRAKVPVHVNRASYSP